MEASWHLLASLSLGRPGASGAVLCVAVLWLGWLVLNYRRLGAPRWVWLSALGLKTTGIALILLCFLEPQWLELLPKEKGSLVVFLLDDSRSMRLPDSKGGVSRGERLREVWNGGAVSWRADVEQSFRTRGFAFGRSLRELGAKGELQFEDRPTALRLAIEEAFERVGERPAAVVVLTDGVDLERADPKSVPGGKGSTQVPVFPVLFGKPEQGLDLSIGRVTATQTAFEEAPVTVTVEIRLSGTTKTRAVVSLESGLTGSDAGKPAVLAEQSVEVAGDGSAAVVALQCLPVKSGPGFYRVKVRGTEWPPEKEVTAENNERWVSVYRAPGPHRLLYVSGRPNWEFGPLRRALDLDLELQLRGIIRVAKREPKFAFKGRGGESSNPFFRGFQTGQGAELERHDKPVLVRVNVEGGDELAAGFPRTAEELFGYKAVLIDDLEAEFFSAEQLRLLQRFVSERGGGVLMMGGMESFEMGGWRGTAMESVLPVWLEKGEGLEKESSEGSFRWQLSREGMLAPWLRRRKTEGEELSRLSALPALEVMNGVGAIKPAATVLAWGERGGERRPALVTQRYGAGRCGALLGGDLFAWGLGDRERGEDLAKFWRQIARWLVADVPDSLGVTIQPSKSVHSASIQVRVRDKQARPVEEAEVEVWVRRAEDAEASAVQIRAEPGDELGVYSAEYPMAVDGPFVVRAEAKDSSGLSLGRAEGGWVQDGREAEFRMTLPDRVGMAELAKVTGGEVLEPEDLEGLAGRLQRAPGVQTEVRVRPLWNTGWMMGLALGCLCGEWVLRRRNGLA
jgi:uncharacterized membrane protein